MPILYSFKRCPYAMRARMALYLSDISCELREVSLKNKPPSMIKLSPKGTVPVMLLENGKVIDESIDIINWCLEQKFFFEDKLSKSETLYTERTISLFDSTFKFHLDRYKYSSRYNDVDESHHRECCFNILKEIELYINDSNHDWFFTNSINKIDIAILPFIRQFRIANSEWFDNNEEIPKVKKWLSKFLKSTILKNVMINYKVWDEDSPVSLFPISQ